MRQRIFFPFALLSVLYCAFCWHSLFGSLPFSIPKSNCVRVAFHWVNFSSDTIILIHFTKCIQATLLKVPKWNTDFISSIEIQRINDERLQHGAWFTLNKMAKAYLREWNSIEIRMFHLSYGRFFRFRTKFQIKWISASQSLQPHIPIHFRTISMCNTKKRSWAIIRVLILNSNMCILSLFVSFISLWLRSYIWKYMQTVSMISRYNSTRRSHEIKPFHSIWLILTHQK